MKTDTSVVSRFGLFQGILPMQRQEIAKDIFAGITLAALGIPEVMGYARHGARRSEVATRAVGDRGTGENGSSEIDLRGFRFELAHHLIGTGRHDVALPLLDANLATGAHFNHGYGWLMYAAAVWRVTRDRPRALAFAARGPRPRYPQSG